MANIERGRDPRYSEIRQVCQTVRRTGCGGEGDDQATNGTMGEGSGQREEAIYLAIGRDRLGDLYGDSGLRN